MPPLAVVLVLAAELSAHAAYGDAVAAYGAAEFDRAIVTVAAAVGLTVLLWPHGEE